MDRLSFVFSLVLIFSVSTITFGSVIKANDPNGQSLDEPPTNLESFPNYAPKELQAFFNRSHHQSNKDRKSDAQVKLQGQNGLKDQESETYKRVDPETLKPGRIEDDGSVVKLIKNSKIAIDIENQSGFAWEGVSKYISVGTAQNQLPSHVSNGDKVVFVVSNRQGSVGGALMYFIEDIQSTLAITYYAGGKKNYYSVQMYLGDWRANVFLYYLQSLFFSKAADNQWHTGALGFVDYRVSMSTSPQAILKVEIYKSK